MIQKTLLLIFFALQVMAQNVVLDVRTAEEFQIDHVKGALNMDVTKPEFKEQVSKLNREDKIQIYCKSGARSTKAISIMKEMGFKKLQNLGGLDEAKKQIYVK